MSHPAGHHSVEIKALESQRVREFLEVCEAAFGEVPAEASLERHERLVDPSRFLCAAEHGRIVGTAGAFELQMTVPGARLPVAAVTMVGVVPTHRRRGILSEMMRRLLHEARARGEPVTALYASEGGIYQRFGYGLATIEGSMTLARERSSFAFDVGHYGTPRIVDEEEALRFMPDVYDRVAAAVPGHMSRSVDWWKNHRLVFDDGDNGKSPIWRMVLEGNNGHEGYAIYRIEHRWAGGVPCSRLEVMEAAASTPEADAAVWRYLLGVDLVEEVTCSNMPVDHPLAFWLEEPRRMRLRLADGLWVRIVDVAGALEARRYSADGSLVIDLQDDFMPDNSGRYQMNVSAGQATVSKSRKAPQLELNMRDLSAIYLGGVRGLALTRAGRIHEIDSGAAGMADAMFSWGQTAYCREIF